MQNIPTITLNDGNSMPLAGFGVHKIVTQAAINTSVKSALACGYRLFDTASVYRNEDLLGNALAASGIPRNELFLTSKVWNTAQRLGDIEGALMRSLERLRTEYLDLYLVHWPVPGCFNATWKELERLQKAGLIRSIGVSNFNIHHFEELKQVATVVPAVNQIEYHPLYNQESIHAYCREHGIAVQAYAPLARGAYSDREMLQKIASDHGKNALQVGLRWLVQKEVSIIPRSSKPEHIRSNIDIFDFTLTDVEMKTIDTMDEKYKAASIPEDMRDALL